MKALRPFCVFVCLCVLLRMMQGTAEALDPEQKITQYSLTQWGHRDGLPSTAIYSLAQTPDGFLWLGTSDGLVRFDGLRSGASFEDG
jgi:ligand-binding sensor domain-containing protein